MQKVQQRPTSAFVNIAANTIAIDVFVIHACNAPSVIGVFATHSDRPRAGCADSESQTLAIKIFSCTSRVSRTLLFDAFSSREPASTSLENAMLMVNADPDFAGVLEHFSAKGKLEKRQIPA